MSDTVTNIISLHGNDNPAAAFQPFLTKRCRIARELVEHETHDEWREIILPTGLHALEEIDEFDFNKIVPMPDSIRATRDGYFYDETIGWFALLEENLLLHGYPDWRSWVWGVWGCQWESVGYEFVNEGKSLKIFTNYKPPVPALKKLSQILQNPLFLEYDDFDGIGTYLIQPDGSHQRTYQKT